MVHVPKNHILIQTCTRRPFTLNLFLFSRALAQEAWQAWGPWKVLGGSGDHPVSGLLFGAKILLNKRGPNKKMPHVGQGGLVFLF